jgi:hypothetical protein
MAFHDETGPLVREFSSTDELTDAGFTVAKYPAINKIFSQIFSQNPRPPTAKLGKRVTGTLTQIIEMAPVAPQGEGFVWTVVIDGTSITYAEQAADTPTLIVAGLLAAVNLAAVTVTASSPVVTTLTLTGDAPPAIRVHSFDADPTLFDIDDVTLDPGITTDLTAVQGYDEDWIGLLLDSNSPAEVLATATWAESRIKIFGADGYQSKALDPGDSTDIGSLLQTALREHTYHYWTHGSIAEYYAAALMGAAISFGLPGRVTWDARVLRGVSAYLPQGKALTTTQQSTLEAKSYNHLEPGQTNQRNQTGVVSSGTEFVDTIHFSFYLAARAKEVTEAAIERNVDTNGKVPYTDPGINAVLSPLRQFIAGEVTAEALAADPEPVITAPTANEVTAANRAERNYGQVVIQAQYTGAIHTVNEPNGAGIQINLTV